MIRDSGKMIFEHLMVDQDKRITLFRQPIQNNA